MWGNSLLRVANAALKTVPEPGACIPFYFVWKIYQHLHLERQHSFVVAGRMVRVVVSELQLAHSNQWEYKSWALGGQKLRLLKS